MDEPVQSVDPTNCDREPIQILGAIQPTGFPITRFLDNRGIPLLFATRYGEQAPLPMGHRSRIVMQKPYTLEIVARAVHELTGNPAPGDETLAAASDTND